MPSLPRPPGPHNTAYLYLLFYLFVFVSVKKSGTAHNSLPVFVILFVCVCIWKATRAPKYSLAVFVILFICICICKVTQASKYSLPVFVIFIVCICICICKATWPRTLQATCNCYFHSLYFYLQGHLCLTIQPTCICCFHSLYHCWVFICLVVVYSFVLLLYYCCVFGFIIVAYSIVLSLCIHCVFICNIVAFSCRSYPGHTIQPTDLYLFFSLFLLSMFIEQQELLVIEWARSVIFWRRQYSDCVVKECRRKQYQFM